MDTFKAYVKKINQYHEAVGLLYWDLRTGAPRKGMESRSEVIGMLSTEMFKLTVSEEMGQFLEELTQPDRFEQLDAVTKKMVTECKKTYDRSVKIPTALYQEYVVLTSQAESVWEEAKDQADFAMFLPYLEKIIDYNRQFIDLWGKKQTPYDTLLDIYEPDMTVAQLDRMFEKLRDHTVALVREIEQSPHKPDTSFLQQPFDQDKQRQFSEFILKQMGYDFDAGRLDVSVHPFAISFGPGDVRITTNYKSDDMSFSLFSTIHEGGHALYEQNISKDLQGTLLCEGTSMGIHESQSRLWENMIGRSYPFWSRYFTDLQHAFSTCFTHVSAHEFYRAINEVKPSLIRIEADELTYNLHIIIRYELEKMIFNEGLQAKDVPEVWNEKYKQYLGVTPSHDGEGVLQDVHWSGGSFGYFPSYSLGNMVAAQIMNTIKRDIPDVEQHIAEGRLLMITDWLSENIYQYGKLLDPQELIVRVTGEALNPQYLIDYLDTKFREIYQL